MRESFVQGLFLGLFLFVGFWLLVVALLIIASMFAVLGPVGGAAVAIVLLGLCFVTLHRIFKRARAAWKAAKRASELSSS